MTLKAQLTISLPSNDIEVGLFYSSSLDLDSESMNTFAKLAFKSAQDRKRPLLNLRIHSFGCPTCPEGVRQHSCLSDGRYCAFFPKVGDFLQTQLMPEDFAVETKYDIHGGDIVTDFSGRDLMLSSLREKCSHLEVKRLINDSASPQIKENLYLEELVFQEFVNRTKRCEKAYDKNQTYTKICLLSEDKVLRSIGAGVQKCMDESFVVEGDLESDNKLLADDMAWAREHHIDYHPSITINNFTYRGDIDFVDVE